MFYTTKMDLKTKQIYFFWIDSNNEENNEWLVGTVLSNRQVRSGLYKVRLTDTDGQEFIRLIDLSNPIMRPFWAFVSDKPNQSFDFQTRHWVCCSTCEKWYKVLWVWTLQYYPVTFRVHMQSGNQTVKFARNRQAFIVPRVCMNWSVKEMFLETKPS